MVNYGYQNHPNNPQPLLSGFIQRTNMITLERILKYIKEDITGDGSITFDNDEDLAMYVLTCVDNLTPRRTEQDLIDRLTSRTRKVERLEESNKKLTNDNKAKNGLINSLKDRNTRLKAKLSHMIDLTPDAHDKIEALMAIAEDSKYLD